MRLLSLTLILALTPVTLPAQRSPAQTGSPAPLEIGAVAPDFSLRGATRYGVLANPVRLSDYKGKTVVLEWTSHECPYVGKHYRGNNM